MTEDRLFVPLSTQPFYDFKENGKHFEVRAYGRQFTEKFVRPGRVVELRHGYSIGKSIWGKIGKVVVGSLEDIFAEVDFKRVEPRMKSRREAIADNLECLGRKAAYIAFEVRSQQYKEK